MSFFNLSVEVIERMPNPGNGEIIILERHVSETYGWEYFKLSDDSKRVLGLQDLEISTETRGHFENVEDMG